jgi:uncharacterized OsmC-like protein
MNKQTINMVNGVDLTRLGQTIDAIAADTELATFKFRVNNKWVDGGYNQSEIKNFYATKQEIVRAEPFLAENDEPDVLLGQDNAPNPVEFVLHALAGCLTTSMVYHAAAKGYEVSHVSSTLEGELDLRGFLGMDANVRKGYKKIAVRFDIEGNLSDEQKEEMLGLTRFSPVFDIVSNAVPVEITMKTRKEVPAAAV